MCLVYLSLSTNTVLCSIYHRNKHGIRASNPTSPPAATTLGGAPRELIPTTSAGPATSPLLALFLLHQPSSRAALQLPPSCLVFTSWYLDPPAFQQICFPVLSSWCFVVWISFSWIYCCRWSALLGDIVCLHVFLSHAKK
jgi:hypothetical protein